MFTVDKRTIKNPFKPEIIDNTTITLQQDKPFVQMSYKYEGDFSNLTDQEAINKVLEDFYKENYQSKEQDKKLTELELDIAKLKENNTFQYDLITQAIFELTEAVLSESEVEVDASNSDVDGVEDKE